MRWKFKEGKRGKRWKGKIAVGGMYEKIMRKRVKGEEEWKV